MEGPKSLPVTPKCSVEPNTPSPLVICSTSFDHYGGAKPKISPAVASTKMVKSSSATGKLNEFNRQKLSKILKPASKFLTVFKVQKRQGGRPQQSM